MQYSQELVPWNRTPKLQFPLKLGPVLSVLVLTGVLPFSEFGKYSVHLRWRYLSCLVVKSPILMIMPGSMVFFATQEQSVSKVYLTLITDYTRVVIRLAALWVVFIVASTHRKKFQTIWVYLAGVEFPEIYNSRISTVCLITGIYSLRLVLFDFMLPYTIYKFLNHIFELQMLYTFWMLILLTLFYCAVLRCLGHKLQSFIERLKNRYDDGGIKDFFTALDVMKIISQLLGYHTLFLTAGNILELIQGGFLFFVYAYNPPKFSFGEIYIIFFHTMHMLSVMTIMWVQIIECAEVQDKVDAFYRELFRLMRESKTLCSNKKLCLYVSMRKTVNFTACGFFNLGYPLITSIIAAATTYLVILVQFSIPKSE